jgi:hypothetical protein
VRNEKQGDEGLNRQIGYSVHITAPNIVIGALKGSGNLISHLRLNPVSTLMLREVLE